MDTEGKRLIRRAVVLLGRAAVRSGQGGFQHSQLFKAYAQPFCFFFKQSLLFHSQKDELHYVFVLALEYDEAAAQVIHHKNERAGDQLRKERVQTDQVVEKIDKDDADAHGDDV